MGGPKISSGLYGESQSHDALVDRCALSNHMHHMVTEGYSNSFKMSLRTAGPIVGLPAPTDQSIPRSLDF